MSTPEWLANSSIVEALGWTLVHSLWQGFACAILLAIALYVARQKSASTRYILSTAALALAFACAIATFVLLNHRIDTTPILATHSQSPLPISSHPTHITLPDIDLAIPTPSLAQRLSPMLPWLVLLWAIGVIALGCYQLTAWIFLRRLRLSAEPTTDACAIATFNELIDRLHISRPVQLSRSMLVQVPTVIGWLKPLVLLPMNALTGLTTDQLRGLLAHELAHVRRHDYLVNIFLVAIETILFYHPAVWWIGKTIRQERENACDDLAAIVCDRATYAQALARMESLRQSPAIALSARGGLLLPRIRRILGLDDSRPRRGYFPGAVIASILIAAAISLVIFHARPSRADTPLTHPSTPTTQPEMASALPTADDLKAISQDYQIGKNDLLSVGITDLPKRGEETIKQLRVSESGKINLYIVGEVSIIGNTEVQAEHIIAKAYETIMRNPVVSVAVLEARARTFSILGAVQQPGQYAIPKSDFRVLDALVLAHDVNAPVKSLLVLRSDPNQPGGHRNIQIPIDELRNGNMNYNIVVHPDDLIIVKSPDQDNDPTARNIWQLKQELADVDLSLNALSKTLGPNNPRIKSLKDAREAMTHALRDLASTPSSSQPSTNGQNYFVGGDVPRTGEYSLSSQPITLLQALTDAGADTEALKDRTVQVWRKMNDNRSWIARFTIADLLNNAGDPFLLAPDDVVAVRPPEEKPAWASDPEIQKLGDALRVKTQAMRAAKEKYGADHPTVKQAEAELVQDTININNAIDEFNKKEAASRPVFQVISSASTKPVYPSVRLVVSPDQITLEGKPIQFEALNDELLKLPNRPQTVLEIASSSDDVTVGRVNRVFAIGSKLNFKYLSQIGVHPLGSKAGDEPSPTR